MTTPRDPTCLTGNPPAPCAKCEPSVELEEAEDCLRECARRAIAPVALRGSLTDIEEASPMIATEIDRLREALRAACERARVAEAEVQRKAVVVDACLGYLEVLAYQPAKGGQSVGDSPKVRVSTSIEIKRFVREMRDPRNVDYMVAETARVKT